MKKSILKKKEGIDEMTKNALRRSGTIKVSGVFDTNIREKHLNAVKEYLQKEVDEKNCKKVHELVRGVNAKG